MYNGSLTKASQNPSEDVHPINPDPVVGNDIGLDSKATIQYVVLGEGGKKHDEETVIWFET